VCIILSGTYTHTHAGAHTHIHTQRQRTAGSGAVSLDTCQGGAATYRKAMDADAFTFSWKEKFNEVCACVCVF
jgi:hypothetical protein